MFSFVTIFQAELSTPLCSEIKIQGEMCTKVHSSIGYVKKFDISTLDWRGNQIFV